MSSDKVKSRTSPRLVEPLQRMNGLRMTYCTWWLPAFDGQHCLSLDDGHRPSGIRRWGIVMHDHSNSWTNKYRRQPLRQLYCTLRSRHTVVEAKIENVSNVCTCRQQVSRMVFTGQSRAWEDIDRRRGKVGRGPLKRGCALHWKKGIFPSNCAGYFQKSWSQR